MGPIARPRIRTPPPRPRDGHARPRARSRQRDHGRPTRDTSGTDRRPGRRHALARYVVRVEPLASLPSRISSSWSPPTFQRYLTGPLAEPVTGAGARALGRSGPEHPGRNEAVSTLHRPARRHAIHGARLGVDVDVCAPRRSGGRTQAIRGRFHMSDDATFTASDAVDLLAWKHAIVALYAGIREDPYRKRRGDSGGRPRSDVPG